MEDKETTRSTQNPDKGKPQCFKRITYTEQYLPRDSPWLRSRVNQLYCMVESFRLHNNKSWWCKCCSTMVRNIDPLTLDHPPGEIVKIKHLIEKHNITSEETLWNYMIHHLPKNDEGHLRMPQINMYHPIKCKVEPEEEQPLQESVVKTEASMKLEEPDYRNQGYSEEIKLLRQQNAQLAAGQEELKATLKVN